MKVLCLFQKFSFSSSTIYLDLVNALVDKGHEVLIAAGTSEGQDDTKLEVRGNIRTAYVTLPDQFHADKIRKGLIQLTIGRKILSTVKKFFWQEKIDLIIYPTPPITLAGILKPLKKHYGAVNYLMLKDIFPQNAVDLKMMGDGGLLHHYFRRMEKKLYRDSDRIGCMSEGNLKYIRSNEPDIPVEKLEIFPNTVRILPEKPEQGTSGKVVERPVTFMFGGNLGRPQAVDFLLEGIRSLKDFSDARFLFIGDGTEAPRIQEFIEKEKPGNLVLEKQLPRDEYEKRLSDADIGIVSLSPDFTIPNYPSRILSYMQLGKPVFAVTDRVTDIHALVTYEARCGWWCASDDVEGFCNTVKKIVSEREQFNELGMNGRNYLVEHFDVYRSVELLEKAIRTDIRP